MNISRRAHMFRTSRLLGIVVACVLALAPPAASTGQAPPATATATATATPTATSAPPSTPEAAGAVSAGVVTPAVAVANADRAQGGASAPADPQQTATPAAPTVTAQAPAPVGGEVSRVPALIAVTVAPARLPVASDRVEAVFVQLVSADGVAATSATPVLVRLASNDPGVATLPSTVEIPAGESAVAVPVRAVAEGMVAFTAQASGLTSGQARLTVSARATSTQAGLLDLAFAPPSFLVGAPGPAWLTVSTVQGEGRLPAVATSDTEVRLVSSNPGAIAVPSTAVIPAGEFFVTVPVNVGAAGDATVTALRSGLESATADAIVFSDPLPAIELSVTLVPAQVLAGGGMDVRAVVQARAEGGAPAALPCGRLELASSRPDVLAVPDHATPECLAGRQSAAVDIEPGRAPGSTTITVASEGLAPGSADVRASGEAPAELVATLAPAALRYGVPSAGWLAIEVLDRDGAPVTLTGDLPVRIAGPQGAAPPVVTVPQGVSYVIVPLGRVNAEDAGEGLELSATGLSPATVALSQAPVTAAGPAGAAANGGSSLALNLGGMSIPLLWIFAVVAIAVIGVIAIAIIGSRQQRRLG